MVAIFAIVLSTTAIAKDTQAPVNFEIPNGPSSRSPNAKPSVAPTVLVDIDFPARSRASRGAKGQRGKLPRLGRWPAGTTAARKAKLSSARRRASGNDGKGARKGRARKSDDAKLWVPEAFNERPVMLSPPRPAYQRLR